jgi:hypothetical protein
LGLWSLLFACILGSILWSALAFSWLLITSFLVSSGFRIGWLFSGICRGSTSSWSTSGLLNFIFTLFVSSRVQDGVVWEDFSDYTSSNSFTTFSEGKSGSLGDGEWEVELSSDFQVVSGLGDLNVFREENFGSSIGSLEVKLKISQ